MKIYTKTGDQGETSLFGGRRLPKDALRIECYGTVDELNAFVGLLRDHMTDDDLRKVLFTIQNRLFTIGARLATDPEKQSAPVDLKPEDIALLEQEIDRMDMELPPLRHFILPGGHPTVSYAHLARTICRRAERLVVSLHQQEPVAELLLQYLNRLSDYFFVVARYMSHRLGVAEIKWKGRD